MSTIFFPGLFSCMIKNNDFSHSSKSRLQLLASHKENASQDLLGQLSLPAVMINNVTENISSGNMAQVHDVVLYNRFVCVVCLLL